jgi:hypothetical protein
MNVIQYKTRNKEGKKYWNKDFNSVRVLNETAVHVLRWTVKRSSDDADVSSYGP